jgi:hypothetical protein
LLHHSFNQLGLLVERGDGKAGNADQNYEAEGRQKPHFEGEWPIGEPQREKAAAWQRVWRVKRAH